jgi:hypothetical protein
MRVQEVATLNEIRVITMTSNSYMIIYYLDVLNDIVKENNAAFTGQNDPQ